MKVFFSQFSNSSFHQSDKRNETEMSCHLSIISSSLAIRWSREGEKERQVWELHLIVVLHHASSDGGTLCKR